MRKNRSQLYWHLLNYVNSTYGRIFCKNPHAFCINES